MTPDERETLLDMLNDTKVEHCDGGDGLDECDEIICNYIDDLLAAKDEEIARLQAENKQQRGSALLTQVLTSSIDLVTRFDGTLTERGSFAKFNEESDELKKAIYLLMASPQAHPQLMEHVAEELADVLITAAGMASYAGVPLEILLPVIRAKVAANAAKSPETHRWDDRARRW